MRQKFHTVQMLLNKVTNLYSENGVKVQPFLGAKCLVPAPVYHTINQQNIQCAHIYTPRHPGPGRSATGTLDRSSGRPDPEHNLLRGQGVPLRDTPSLGASRTHEPTSACYAN